MVTDTLLIGRTADLSIYVCRADYTRKAEFSLINELSENNKLPNLCIAINGLDLQKRSTAIIMATVNMASIMAMASVTVMAMDMEKNMETKNNRFYTRC